MNFKTYMESSIVSTSSQTNQTVSSFKAHSLKAAILKTSALENGNEINNGTIVPSTHRVFSKILYNIFLLYSKTSHSNNITDFTYRDLPLQFAKHWNGDEYLKECNRPVSVGFRSQPIR